MGSPQTGSIPFDIDAREAQVVGEGQRIEEVPNEAVDQEVWDITNSLRAANGAPPIDAIPGYMRTVYKHRPIFDCQMQMGMMLFQGTIPPRERELAVLRNAWLCRAPYEWGEHVAISLRYGIAHEEIERVTQGSSASGWSEHERAILRGVEELHADHALSSETWDILAKSWNEQQLIEFPMLIGQYIATACVQNTLRIRLSDGNPGLRHR